MDLRVALLAVGMCVAAYGCATTDQQTAAPSAAQPQAQGRYVTGSRIPVRDDDTGAGSVSATSKEAYQDEMMQRANTGTSGR